MRQTLKIAAWGIAISVFLFSLAVIWWFMLAAAGCGFLIATAIRRVRGREAECDILDTSRRAVESEDPAARLDGPPPRKADAATAAH
jgi:hypothetical protein